MQIAILSDIHDNIWRLRPAVAWCQDNPNIEAMICCGDLCSPFVMGLLAEGFDHPIHLVFGNNDADTFRITRIAEQYGNVRLYGELAELLLLHGFLHGKNDTEENYETADGLRIAVNHFHDIASALMASARYDVVCFGHNHQLQIEYFNRQTGERLDGPQANAGLYLNPGPIMGYDPGTGSDVPSTFLVLDTNTLTVSVKRVTEKGVIGHDS